MVPIVSSLFRQVTERYPKGVRDSLGVGRIACLANGNVPHLNRLRRSANGTGRVHEQYLPLRRQHLLK